MQFFRKVLKGNFVIIWATLFMYDNKQFCRNSFSYSHILSTSDAANMLFAFVPVSRDFDLKYFLSLASISKISVADTFVLFPFSRLYKYFDLINLPIVFHRRFSISAYSTYTNGSIVWNFFKNISNSVAKYRWSRNSAICLNKRHKQPQPTKTSSPSC